MVMWDIAKRLNTSTWVVMLAAFVVGLFSLLVAFGFFSDKISDALAANSGTLSTTITNAQVNTGSWTNVPSDGNMTSQTITMGTTKPFRFDVNNTGSVAIKYNLKLEISFDSPTLREQAVLLIYPGSMDSATILANIASNNFTGAIIGPSLSDATAITTSTGVRYGLSAQISTGNVLDSALPGGQTGAAGAGGLSSRTHSFQLVFVKGGDAITDPTQYDNKVIEVSMQADATAYSSTIAWTATAQKFFRITSKVDAAPTGPCPNPAVTCTVAQQLQGAQWTYQFNGITVTNTGSTTYQVWWITFDVPADAVVDLGNASWSRSGNTITLSGPSWWSSTDRMLAPGATSQTFYAGTIKTATANMVLTNMVVHYVDDTGAGLSAIPGLTTTATCDAGWTSGGYLVKPCTVVVTNNSGQSVRIWRFEADWGANYSVSGFWCAASYSTTSTKLFITGTSSLANGTSATYSCMQLGGPVGGWTLSNYSIKGVW